MFAALLLLATIGATDAADSAPTSTSSWILTRKLDGSTAYVYGFKDAQGYVHPTAEPTAKPSVNFGVKLSPKSSAVGAPKADVMGTDREAAKLILAPIAKAAAADDLAQCDRDRRPRPAPDPLERAVAWKLEPIHWIGIAVGLFVVAVVVMLLFAAAAALFVFLFRKKPSQ